MENTFDFVYVGLETGVGSRARELTFTGDSVPSPWFSSSNYVTISMFTDYSVRRNGFQVTLTDGGKLEKERLPGLCLANTEPLMFNQ